MEDKLDRIATLLEEISGNIDPNRGALASLLGPSNVCEKLDVVIEKLDSIKDSVESVAEKLDEIKDAVGSMSSS